jgi:hypothetical protein
MIASACGLGASPKNAQVMSAEREKDDEQANDEGRGQKQRVYDDAEFHGVASRKRLQVPKLDLQSSAHGWLIAMRNNDAAAQLFRRPAPPLLTVYCPLPGARVNPVPVPVVPGATGAVTGLLADTFGGATPSRTTLGGSPGSSQSIRPITKMPATAKPAIRPPVARSGYREEP